MPAAAVLPDAEAARAAEGGTLVQLAAQPAVAGALRNAARGHQQAVYSGLRLPGPPVALHEGRWLVGWSCAEPPPAGAAAAGCTGQGLFLAFDVRSERLILMLLEAGVPVYLTPPRTNHWPAALAMPFGVFASGLAAGPVFGRD